MSDDPHGTADIPVGTDVVVFDSSSLGQVRDIHPHFLLVGRNGQHEDLEVPVRTIIGVVNGKLQAPVNQESVTSVDNEAAAHRLNEDQRLP